MRKVVKTLLCIGLVALFGNTGVAATSEEEKQLETFISAHLEKLKPLSKESNLAYWQASITGKPEDYDRMKASELAMRRLYGNAGEFARLKAWNTSGAIRDARLQRQLVRLHNAYLENQIDPALMKQMVDLGAEIAERFHTYRATLDGTTVTLNEIDSALRTESDSRKREAAWRAGKQVGAAVAPDMVRLVRLRNQAARSVGFDNYRTLTLTLGEQDPKDLDRIFAELERLTNEPFRGEKAQLDAILAKMYGVAADGLMPWHYHDLFFQRAPMVYGESLDRFYEKADVRDLARRFYASIDLPIDDILARSDLYERPGKDQHAFEMDVDREGDVRVLANLRNNEYWMETGLHELGHAVYSKYHDRGEPWLLRDPAHSFCTEAVAMFFGRLSRNAAWMQAMLKLSDEQRVGIEASTRKALQAQEVIFARWAMVMFHFEREMYANPDQDLDALWWRLVEKYQGLKRPANAPPSAWAAKLHFTVAPCYYHNYMLGELLASQLHHSIAREILQTDPAREIGLVNRKEVGRYLREKVFAPGAVYPWEEMIRRATGEPLTAKYFVEQFVR
jgi:peptidyl-dipeptidase A